MTKMCVVKAIMVFLMVLRVAFTGFSLPMEPMRPSPSSSFQRSTSTIEKDHIHSSDIFENLSPIHSSPPELDHHDHLMDSLFEHGLDPAMDPMHIADHSQFPLSPSGFHFDAPLDSPHSPILQVTGRDHIPQKEYSQHDNGPVYHHEPGTSNLSPFQYLYAPREENTFQTTETRNDLVQQSRDERPAHLQSSQDQSVVTHVPASTSSVHPSHFPQILHQPHLVSTNHKDDHIYTDMLPEYDNDWSHSLTHEKDNHPEADHGHTDTVSNVYISTTSNPSFWNQDINVNSVLNNLSVTDLATSHDHGIDQENTVDDQTSFPHSINEPGSSSGSKFENDKDDPAWKRLYRLHRRTIVDLLEYETGRSADLVRRQISKNGSMDIIQGLLSEDESRKAKAIDDLHFGKKKSTPRRFHLGKDSDRVTRDYRDQFGLTLVQARHELDTAITSTSAALLKNSQTFESGANMVHNAYAPLINEQWKDKGVSIFTSPPTTALPAQAIPKRQRRGNKNEYTWATHFPLPMQYLARIVANYRGGKVDTISRLLPKKGSESIGHRLASGKEELIEQAIIDLDLPPLKEPLRKQLLGEKANEITRQYMKLYDIDITKACAKLNRSLTPEIAQLLLNPQTFKEGARKIPYNKYLTSKDDSSTAFSLYVARMQQRDPLPNNNHV